jgi:hypothetical protein
MQSFAREVEVRDRIDTAPKVDVEWYPATLNARHRFGGDHIHVEPLRRRLLGSQHEIKYGLVDDEGDALQCVDRIKHRLHLSDADSLTCRILNRAMALTNEWDICPVVGG